MKTTKLNYLLLSLTLSTSVFASHGDKGNGGDAIICGDNVRLLDHVEATEKKVNGCREFTINVPGENRAKKVETILNRLKSFDYFRYIKVKEYAEELLTGLKDLEDNNKTDNNIVIFTNNNLPDVDDSHELMIPNGCVKEQLVIQRERPTEFDHPARYTFKKVLWDRMDSLDQALTVTHEAIYRLAIEGFAVDSRYTRLLNEFLASTEVEKGIKGYANIMSYSKKLKGGITHTLPVLITQNDNKKNQTKQTIDLLIDTSTLEVTAEGFSFNLVKRGEAGQFSLKPYITSTRLDYDDSATDYPYIRYISKIGDKVLNTTVSGYVTKISFDLQGNFSTEVVRACNFDYDFPNGDELTCSGSKDRTNPVKFTALSNGTIKVVSENKGLKGKMDSKKFNKVQKITIGEKSKVTEVL